MLRASYLFILLICVLPTLFGLAGVAVSSVGYIPPLDMHLVSLNGFSKVFAWEGVWRSIGMTVYSGLASTYLACLLTFSILQATWGTRFWRKVEVSLSPLLAVPHVAFAIGFAFLFAPTGMGMRLLDVVGISADPNASDLALLIKDPHALGLILMLALKEVPFLLLMSISILQQVKVNRVEKVAASLGYSRAEAWWKCVFPQWLSKLRFPLLAVMAYGLSVVDVALIIGPTNPPTFAVLVWQWFNDPDLALLPRASAGAVVLLAISLVLIGVARLIEWAVTQGFKQWQYSGRTGFALPGKTLFAGMLILSISMIPLMLIWSVAQRWRFPDLLPSRYSLRFWEHEWDSILGSIEQSIVIALISASLALLMALLAHEYRLRHRIQVPGYIIAVPMLVPQLSILFGMQVATLYVNGDAHFFWVCWAHLFFAFPYVYLSLDGPWRSYDERLTRAALSLGKSPLRVWLKVKMPILLPAILFAWAIGISVSLAQYLPTLVLGAGRITTLTTEAVALSSGFDRRVTAIYAIWQALLPFLFFSLAILTSRLQLTLRRKPIKELFHNELMSRKPRHS
ncbi:thiamine ABC transporter permease [Grimontia sp. SpTr1]|uniref:ABC transporter permease n=1 Tax=Grimontia sp. SpTr1 TaxID=2995319 RepID=UPI00248BDFCC|nr:thiamine ABC transporter permease [Grimontia sp. SpTr1]